MKRKFFSEGTDWEIRALKGAGILVAVVSVFFIFDQNYDISSSRIPLIKGISLFIPFFWLFSTFLGYKVLTKKNYAFVWFPFFYLQAKRYLDQFH